ncbi:uncharacterized protein PGTG_05133 [Puccinia graminis f. sp. tritici CRL 75-36-700-3]|uniref:Uncharacterized protein n=1 Tax=Puccinia graminis f. sp. tritici (strain CRL 75-36-700-3 / race SCCL) TaxID=418459 RepID=E3K6Q8_PUCGT|nr:uncharacterized protein PGTG_05133 [Puccinia graminis f. sp. tritici CRL 75-36-700-3]EFP79908.1 hypothetical protein PGTG_05133 [Puccinia graminis f. sp. tritici CRL 75-36-700-3]
MALIISSSRPLLTKPALITQLAEDDEPFHLPTNFYLDIFDDHHPSPLPSPPPPEQEEQEENNTHHHPIEDFLASDHHSTIWPNNHYHPPGYHQEQTAPSSPLISPNIHLPAPPPPIQNLDSPPTSPPHTDSYLLHESVASDLYNFWPDHLDDYYLPDLQQTQPDPDLAPHFLHSPNAELSTPANPSDLDRSNPLHNVDLLPAARGKKRKSLDGQLQQSLLQPTPRKSKDFRQPTRAPNEHLAGPDQSSPSIDIDHELLRTSPSLTGHKRKLRTQQDGQAHRERLGSDGPSGPSSGPRKPGGGPVQAGRLPPAPAVTKAPTARLRWKVPAPGSLAIPEPAGPIKSYYPRPWEEVQKKAHRFGAHPSFGQPFDQLVRADKSHYDLLTQVVTHRSSKPSLRSSVAPISPDLDHARPLNRIGAGPSLIEAGAERASGGFHRGGASPTTVDGAAVHGQHVPERAGLGWGDAAFGRVLRAVFASPSDPNPVLVLSPAQTGQILDQIRQGMRHGHEGLVKAKTEHQIRDSFFPNLGLWKAVYDRLLDSPDLDQDLLHIFRASSSDDSVGLSHRTLRVLERFQKLCYLFMFYVHIIVSISPPPSQLISHHSAPADRTHEALTRAFEDFKLHFRAQLSNSQSAKGGRPPNWSTLVWHALEHWIRSDPAYAHLIHSSSSFQKPPALASAGSSSSSSSYQIPCQLFFDACFANSLVLFTRKFRRLLKSTS